MMGATPSPDPPRIASPRPSRTILLVSGFPCARKVTRSEYDPRLASSLAPRLCVSFFCHWWAMRKLHPKGGGNVAYVHRIPHPSL